MSEQTTPALQDLQYRVLTKDDALTFSVADSKHVDVTVSIAKEYDEKFSEIVELATQKHPKKNDVAFFRLVAADVIRSAMSQLIAKQLEDFQEAYGRFLIEAVPLRTDQGVLEATIAVQRRIELLKRVPMVDQRQVCDLLGVSKSNPSATMKRYEEKGLLRFRLDGKILYPLLQFNIDAQMIYPEIFEIAAMKPKEMSQFALLDWLVSENANFDTTPADALKSSPGLVVRAFAEFVEEPAHG